MTTFPNARLSNTRSNLALSIAALIGSLAPAAVLIFLGQPATAQAAPAPRVAEVRLDIHDMTPEAARQRIASAASRVCQDVAVNSPLLPRDTHDCRQDAEARATAQLAQLPRQLASRN